MLDTVREINEKRRSSVIVMESGETFWLTWTQLQEHEPFAVGQEVDTDALREWLLPRQYPMALNDAVALLAQRAQASGEIRQKLKRKLYMEDTVEMVLYKLEREGLLNDADFAQQWVEARSTRKLGRSRIAQELRRKGVSADEAEAALDTLDDDEQLAGAIALAEKAAARIKPGEDPRKAMSRIHAMLARRGYGWDVAKEAVSRAMQADDEM